MAFCTCQEEARWFVSGSPEAARRLCWRPRHGWRGQLKPCAGSRGEKARDAGERMQKPFKTWCSYMHPLACDYHPYHANTNHANPNTFLNHIFKRPSTGFYNIPVKPLVSPFHPSSYTEYVGWPPPQRKVRKEEYTIRGYVAEYLSSQWLHLIGCALCMWV